jgi:hypothetical protein
MSSMIHTPYLLHNSHLLNLLKTYLFPKNKKNTGSETSINKNNLFNNNTKNNIQQYFSVNKVLRPI